MSRKVVLSFSILKKYIFLALLFVVYSLIEGLIFIGELTQKLIVYPPFFTIKLLHYIVNKAHNLFINFQTSYKNKINFTRLKPESKTKSKNTFSFYKTVKHFYKMILNFLKNTGLTVWVLTKKTIRKVVDTYIGIYRFFTSKAFHYFIYGFIFCLLTLIVYQSYQFIHGLPSPREIGTTNYAQSTHLYDRNGKLLYEIYRDVNRTPVRIADLPPYVIQATVAIEDKNFYNHKGVSFFGGILRALKDTVKTNELQGGSTITQQLVKSALLSPERTIERKFKEIVLAVWTEQIYSKQQIMEMYLNQVPYGGSAYGIEEAAEIYFGKSAKFLTLSEAALLAGLPRAPSVYSPFVNPKLAMSRRREVLRGMYELGYISRKLLDESLAREVAFLPPKTTIHAPHFVFYTKDYLEQEYGTRKVEESGFRVTTTIDLEIQEMAETILREELAKVQHLNVTNGGILVLNPQTGEILAMVGSVDYFLDTYGAYNVTTAQRQPGSALKPMLYALALERGFTAATPIDDAPIIFQSPGNEPYRPVNYDGKFHGKVTLRYALSNSYNIPAVKVLNQLGVQQFVEFGRQMGVDTWNDSSRFGLSLSLGGGEVTLLDLAQVYSVFATDGYRVEPQPVLKIVDSKERTVLQFIDKKVKVLDPGIAFIISDILSDNVSRQQAFGPGSALEIPGYKVAVKTGTTNEKKDNLTVGYTPEFLVAVWVGNNDNTPMNPYLTSGVTGAAPIWHRVMQYLLENESEGSSFTQPENIVAKPCYGARLEYFLSGTEIRGYCYDTKIKPKENDEDKHEANINRP